MSIGIYLSSNGHTSSKDTEFCSGDTEFSIPMIKIGISWINNSKYSTTEGVGYQKFSPIWITVWNSTDSSTPLVIIYDSARGI